MMVWIMAICAMVIALASLCFLAVDTLELNVAEDWNQ